MSNHREQVKKLMSLAEAYHGDEALRTRADADPRGVLAENGIDAPADADLRIVANTTAEIHFIMPSDPNADLMDEDLDAVAGGKTVGVSNYLGLAAGPPLGSALALMAGNHPNGQRPFQSETRHPM